MKRFKIILAIIISMHIYSIRWYHLGLDGVSCTKVALGVAAQAIERPQGRIVESVKGTSHPREDQIYDVDHRKQQPVPLALPRDPIHDELAVQKILENPKVKALEGRFKEASDLLLTGLDRETNETKVACIASWAYFLSELGSSRDPVESQQFFAEASKSYEMILDRTNSRQNGIIYNNYAVNLLRMRSPSKALDAFKIAEAGILKSNDDNLISVYYFNISRTYGQLAYYDASIDNYIKAIQINKNLGGYNRGFEYLCSRPVSDKKIRRLVEFLESEMLTEDIDSLSNQMSYVLSRKDIIKHNGFQYILYCLLEFFNKADIGIEKYNDLWISPLLDITKHTNKMQSSLIKEISKIYNESISINYNSLPEPEQIVPSLFALGMDAKFFRLSRFLEYIGDQYSTRSSQDEALARYLLAWTICPTNDSAGEKIVNILYSRISENTHYHEAYNLIATMSQVYDQEVIVKGEINASIKSFYFLVTIGYLLQHNEMISLVDSPNSSIYYFIQATKTYKQLAKFGIWRKSLPIEIYRKLMEYYKDNKESRHLFLVYIDLSEEYERRNEVNKRDEYLESATEMIGTFEIQEEDNRRLDELKKKKESKPESPMNLRIN